MTNGQSKTIGIAIDAEIHGLEPQQIVNAFLRPELVRGDRRGQRVFREWPVEINRAFDGGVAAHLVPVGVKVNFENRVIRRDFERHGQQAVFDVQGNGQHVGEIGLGFGAVPPEADGLVASVGQLHFRVNRVQIDGQAVGTVIQFIDGVRRENRRDRQVNALGVLRRRAAEIHRCLDLPGQRGNAVIHVAGCQDERKNNQNN